MAVHAVSSVHAPAILSFGITVSSKFCSSHSLFPWYPDQYKSLELSADLPAITVPQLPHGPAQRTRLFCSVTKQPQFSMGEIPMGQIPFLLQRRRAKADGVLCTSDPANRYSRKGVQVEVELLHRPPVSEKKLAKKNRREKSVFLYNSKTIVDQQGTA